MMVCTSISKLVQGYVYSSSHLEFKYYILSGCLTANIFWLFLSECELRINDKAPSPVTLQAVPKLSCKAKIVRISAVPASLNPNTETIRPNEAITVPPGTPGAPIAKIANKKMNSTIVDKGGKTPYKTNETVITKNTSVSTEPHKCMFAKSGIEKSVTSSRNTLLFLADLSATPSVAADDMVPIAVK